MGETNIDTAIKSGLTPKKEKVLSAFWETLLSKDLAESYPELHEYMEESGTTVIEAIKHIRRLDGQSRRFWEYMEEETAQKNDELMDANAKLRQQVTMLSSELQKEKARKMLYMATGSRFTPRHLDLQPLSQRRTVTLDQNLERLHGKTSY
jgi:beta-phosphoglucomutase-like phosphatase (HAD superfamily)